MAVLGPGGEDTGAAMWQFWGRGVRIRGLPCGSFGAGYGGCYVAVLGPGGEDTDEDTGVAMCDARIMLAPWRWEVCGQGASCLLIDVLFVFVVCRYVFTTPLALLCLEKKRFPK